jgi:hypothetical protein
MVRLRSSRRCVAAPGPPDSLLLGAGRMSQFCAGVARTLVQRAQARGPDSSGPDVASRINRRTGPGLGPRSSVMRVRGSPTACERARRQTSNLTEWVPSLLRATQKMFSPSRFGRNAGAGPPSRGTDGSQARRSRLRRSRRHPVEWFIASGQERALRKARRGSDHGQRPVRIPDCELHARHR